MTSIDARLRKLEAATDLQEFAIRVYYLPPEAIDLRGETLEEWCRAHPGEYQIKAIEELP